MRKTSLFNLSVEEENLASIPFAVLEQRVGKRVGKLEVEGMKTLPDGTEARVKWQVQGNNELGLPTEQDLNIFVALGVLTFRNNFAKTVTFSGREIAGILNISSVNGRFYDRIKLAMDRFIPLRFRTLTYSDSHEDVKWVNVFQDASFSLDRKSGRSVGSITWTDRIIDAMDSGFFRVLDARRYMALDGLTTKHMYRFLAMAFENTDVVIVDARELATRHLGLIQLPKYFSRLMQTLEPPLEQLRREEVVGSWHVVSKDEWRIAIRVHANYTPERRALTADSAYADPETHRKRCWEALQRRGLDDEATEAACQRAESREEFYTLDRLAHLTEWMDREEVLPHVASSIARRVIELGLLSDEGREHLDWIEIALNVCAQKKQSKEKMRNSAGLIVKLIRDPEARERLIQSGQAQAMRDGFSRRQMVALRQQEQIDEQQLVIEYEAYRDSEARTLLASYTEEKRAALIQHKVTALRHHERWQRMPELNQRAEAESQVLADLAKNNIPPFEKWRLRRMARQAVLSLFGPELPAAEAGAN